MKKTVKLAGSMEIAVLAEVSVQAVCNWAVRHETFPKPLAVLRMGPIYSEDEVVEWLRATGRSVRTTQR